MKRLLLLGAALALVTAATFPAASEAAVSVGVSVHVGDPYRGLSLHFRSQPDLVRIPDTRVDYVPNYDHDLYRYGRDWYFVEDGSWYRSSSYRGPFFRVDLSSVPQAVCQVPTRYRRSWNGPPDHAWAYGYRRQQGGYDRGQNNQSWGGQQQNGRNDRNDRNDQYDRNDRYGSSNRSDRNDQNDRSGANDRNGPYDRQGDRNDGRDGGNDRQDDRGGW